jgi:SAM-dependent methyltransferase
LQLCKAGFTGGWTPADKVLLLISPNTSEDKSLRAVASSVLTLDVREDIRADYHLDICAAPALLDASFDAVIGHHVFAHVHDDRHAYAEVARILRPDGRLFLTTPLTAGKTHEISVRVNAKDVKLRARKSYLAPKGTR